MCTAEQSWLYDKCCFYFFLLIGVQSIDVSVSVCLSAHLHVSVTSRPTSNFLYMLTVATAQFFCDDGAY